MFDLILAFSLVAVVLMVTALISGLIERSPLSFPLIFLILGVALSGRGFGVIEMEPDDETLEVVATLTLALVLFLDAVQLQVEELGRRWLIPALILGPGTVLIIALGAVPLALIVGFGWIAAFIGGAVLASTDPVVLRDIVRDQRLPRSVRQILKIEAGMNDPVVLPVVLILIAVAGSETGGVGGWVDFLARLLLLGPAIGFAIGGGGSWLMARVDDKWPIRREHQALYGLGLVLAAYAAAAAAGGDGFLAAFAAGLAVVVLNQTMCDCFLEYGETTAEMAMLLSFVLFGAVLSDLAGSVDIAAALVLTALVIFVIRPGVPRRRPLADADELGGARARRLVRAARPQLPSTRPARRASRRPRGRAPSLYRGHRSVRLRDHPRWHGGTADLLVQQESSSRDVLRGARGHGARPLHAGRGRHCPRQRRGAQPTAPNRVATAAPGRALPLYLHAGWRSHCRRRPGTAG